MPSLKRTTEIVDNNYSNLPEEIKSRRADKDELPDSAIAFISDSPNVRYFLLTLRSSRFGAKSTVKCSPNSLNVTKKDLQKFVGCKILH